MFLPRNQVVAGRYLITGLFEPSLTAVVGASDQSHYRLTVEQRKVTDHFLIVHSHQLQWWAPATSRTTA